VRDRLAGKQRRYLYRPQLDAPCVTAISSDRPLRLLDPTAGAAYEFGIDTDADRARNHQPGQALSEALYASVPLDPPKAKLPMGRCPSPAGSFLQDFRTPNGARNSSGKATVRFRKRKVDCRHCLQTVRRLCGWGIILRQQAR
jgi:hypothetical protein